MPVPSRRHFTILNPLGLHLRAAAEIVAVAMKFEADVRVCHDGRDVSGKSVLDLVTLAAECGTTLELNAAGTDAEEVLTALAALFEAKSHGANGACSSGATPRPDSP
jgi:phosphocarrier protein HPr